MEIISQTKNNIKDFENLPKTSEEVGWFWGKAGVFILLVLAFIIDIGGVILGIIDLGTAGILGWILRIVFTLFYACYFIWFWIESNKFNYDHEWGRKFAQKTIAQIKNQTKAIIYSLRIILATSILAKWLPVIGAIIDALPIETLSVIFLFYIWPRLITNLYNE